MTHKIFPSVIALCNTIDNKNAFFVNWFVSCLFPFVFPFVQ